MNNIFFQYYSLVIFIVCIIVMFAVSYMTAPPSYEKINGLTYGTTTLEDKEKSRSSWTKADVVFSILLIAIIVAIYVYFSG
jgi:SSS family solute:Na+ symporter